MGFRLLWLLDPRNGNGRRAGRRELPGLRQAAGARHWPSYPAPPRAATLSARKRAGETGPLFHPRLLVSALTRSKRVALPRRQDNIFRHHYDETITGPDFKRRLNVHVPPRHFHAELSKLAAKFLRQNLL